MCLINYSIFGKIEKELSPAVLFIHRDWHALLLWEGRKDMEIRQVWNLTQEMTRSQARAN